jgi:hypothetical protein
MKRSYQDHIWLHLNTLNFNNRVRCSSYSNSFKSKIWFRSLTLIQHWLIPLITQVIIKIIHSMRVILIQTMYKI